MIINLNIFHPGRNITFFKNTKKTSPVQRQRQPQWVRGVLFLVGISVVSNVTLAAGKAAAASSVVPAEKITEYSLGHLAAPTGIVGGVDGNLWVTECNGDDHKGAIGRFTPAGVHTVFSDGITGKCVFPEGATQWAIATGPDGNMWFTEEFDNRIARITPQGVVTEFPLPGNPSAPFTGLQLYGIAVSANGNVWATQPHAGGGISYINRMTPAGEFTQFPVPETAGQPGLITTGPEGNLWFTLAKGNLLHPTEGANKAAIGRITPAGVISVFPVPVEHEIVNLGGVAAGSDGNIWYVEESGGHIGRITIKKDGSISLDRFSDGLEAWCCMAKFPAGPLTGDHIVGLAAGHDGNLWFTSDILNDVECKNTGYVIGRVTPAGKITRFCGADGTLAAGLVGIAAGGDGNIWFTAGNADRIGKLQLCSSTSRQTTTPDSRCKKP